MSANRTANILWLCMVVMLSAVLMKYFFPDRFFVAVGYLFVLLVVLFLLMMTVLFVSYVRKLRGSIAEEQQQVASMFEYATEGIVLTDNKGLITLINPAALQLFQYVKEELIGASVEKLIPTRFHQKHKQYRDEFHNAPSNRTMDMGRDLYARKKSGKELVKPGKVL